MSLIGVILGRPATAASPPVQPAPPPATAGSTPVPPADPGADAGSTPGFDTGAGSGTPAVPAPELTEPALGSERSVASGGPRGTAGTPITAPATRHEFSLSEAPPPSEDAARAFAQAAARQWRMSAVLAAISGGPRAQALIEAALRPGPVEPGSLLEAIKSLHPAPSLPRSTRTV